MPITIPTTIEATGTPDQISWSSKKVLQTNTATLQRYAELMGAFYMENARWLQTIYANCYQLGMSRNRYLLQVYHLVWLKFASQIDTTDIGILYTSEDKLSTMVVILIWVLTANPNISKEECIRLCEIEMRKNNDTTEWVDLYKEIISTVFERFPSPSL